MVLSTTVCLFGILYALRQRHYAQSRIDTFLRSIRGYEKELQELKEKLVDYIIGIVAHSDSMGMMM